MPNNSPRLPLLCGRGASIIFADDVRYERSGKMLLIGVYGGQIAGISKFPALLSTFSIWVSVWTPSNRPFSRLTAKFYKDDDEFHVHEFPIGGEPKSVPLKHLGEGDSKWVPIIRISSLISFSPFLIEKECVIRCRVETEAEEIPAGSMVFMLDDKLKQLS